jgi:hypothetical protein
MGLLVGAAQAQAEVKRPGTELAVETAKMEVIKKVGRYADFADEVRLSTVKVVGSKKQFIAVELSNVTTQYRVMKFEIVKKEYIACGSQRLTAVEMNAPLGGPVTSIELVDHATRLCEDYRPYRWEARLITRSPFRCGPVRPTPGVPTPRCLNASGSMDLVGKPEPVYHTM